MSMASGGSDRGRHGRWRHPAELRDEASRRDPFSRQRLGPRGAKLAKNKYLILAIVCMAISFFAFMTLVAEADLSFAVPATAASFVFETVLARLVLMERVDAKRWVGAASGGWRRSFAGAVTL